MTLFTAGLVRAALVTAADLVLPLTCPGCHAPRPWCDACAATLAGAPRAVVVPPLTLDRFARAALPAPRVHALARYAGPVRAAIVAAKDRGRRDLHPLLGAAFGKGLISLQDTGALPGRLWLIPAPSRPAAARARGGDPLWAMARAAAARLAARGRPAGVAPCLSLARSTRDSVGLDAAARAANLARAVRFRPRAAPPTSTPVSNAAAVLLDDVFTSGATAYASTAALARAGVPVTQVLVLAAVPTVQPRRLPIARRS